MRGWTCGPFLIGAVALVLNGPIALQRAEAQPSVEPVTSVCELKAKRIEGQVSVMTGAYYNFEYGYFLSTPQCEDTVDGTGVLEIHLPHGKRHDDFPELAKLSSRAWLGENVGRRVYFRGTGQMTFQNGHPEFVLSSADRVWAAD